MNNEGRRERLQIVQSCYFFTEVIFAIRLLYHMRRIAGAMLVCIPLGSVRIAVHACDFAYLGRKFLVLK